jgi:hypothetical protein
MPKRFYTIGSGVGVTKLFPSMTTEKLVSFLLINLQERPGAFPYNEPTYGAPLRLAPALLVNST